MPAIVHVVPTLHWDREWYLPFQVMRRRLVAVLDHVLDLLDGSSATWQFVLDGQVQVIEDYLEVRPEHRERVRRLVRAGHLVVGPLLVQPDVPLTSGEALVRNLLLGDVAARALGGRGRVAYLPDSCGACVQLPQILRLAGLEAVVLARGVDPNVTGGETDLRWEAPDGSGVLLIHVPHGYDTAAWGSIGDPGRWPELAGRLSALSARASGEDVLAMSNLDGSVDDLDARVRELGSWLGEGTDLRLARLDEYVELVRARSAALRVVAGEMRRNEDAPLHPDVATTRVDLKLALHASELRLLRWTEPAAVMGDLLAGLDSRAFLDLAWRLLIQCQSEDSMRGSHVDAVTRAVRGRLEEVDALQDAIAADCLARVAARIEVDPRSAGEAVHIAVFNPLPWRRSSVVRLRVPVPAAWRAFLRQRRRRIRLLDARGRELVFVSRGWELGEHERVRPLRRPDFELRDELELDVLLEDVPGLGCTTARAELASPDIPAETRHAHVGRGPGSGAGEIGVLAGGTGLQNDFVTVLVGPDGRLEVTDRATGQVYRDWLTLVDDGDAGDTYTSSPPEQQSLVHSTGRHTEIAVIEDSSLRAALRVALQLAVPSGLEPGRHRRADDAIPLGCVLRIGIERRSPQIEVRLTIDNPARDHRLRLLVPTDIGHPTVRAGQAFGVWPVACDTGPPAVGAGGEEMSSSTRTVHRCLDVAGQGRGVCVLTGGLRGYEVLADGRSTIALTVLRCVGHLSRRDLLLRRRALAPGQFEVPGAQCPGRHEIRLGLLCHDGGVDPHRMQREALEFEVGLRAVPFETGAGSIPPTWSLLEVEPPLLVEACKPAGRWPGRCVVRIVNPTDAAIAGRLRFGTCVESVTAVDLMESDRGVELGSGGEVGVQLRAHEILSLAVQFRRDTT